MSCVGTNRELLVRTNNSSIRDDYYACHPTMLSVLKKKRAFLHETATAQQKVKKSPEQKRGSIARQIKTDVTHMNTTTTSISSTKKKNTSSLLKHFLKKHLPKPAAHQNGWFLTATRMFRRAEGRAVLPVYAITVDYIK